VMLEVWDMLHDNGIEIPYPQRVLHVADTDKPPPKLID